MEYMDRFSYEIKYMKGKDNVVADGLSRRADYITAAGISFAAIDANIKEHIVASYGQDHNIANLEAAQDSRLQQQDDLWLYDGRLNIPEGRELRQRLLTELHDTPMHDTWEWTNHWQRCSSCSTGPRWWRTFGST